MTITTAFCTSAKQELMQSGHCLNAIVTPTGNTHSNTFVDNVSSIAGVAVGMAVTGSGVPAATVVANVISASTLQLSIATTTSLTGTTLTFTGDVLKMALFKVTANTYGAATNNYSNMTGNGDETTGTGYVAGGTTLVNVSPVISGTTAYATFSPNPNWTSATFSSMACMIYNSSSRQGSTGRSISIHDFGGTQTVTSGTFTVVMPTADATNAILRIA